MAGAAVGKVGRGSGRKKVAKLKINSLIALDMKEHRGQKTWWISSSLQFLTIGANAFKEKKMMVTVRRDREDVFPVVKVLVFEMFICSGCCQISETSGIKSDRHMRSREVRK